jgi:hypothetical protein
MTADLSALVAGPLGATPAAASTAASAAVQLIKATIAELPSAGLSTSDVEADAEAAPLEFEFNPEKIKLTHTAKFKGAGPSGDLQSQIAALGDIEITIDKVIFTGLTTQPTCARLMDWSFPPTGLAADGSSTADPVDLVFSWGPSLIYQVKMRTVGINYVRFAPDGTPTRAEVNITMFMPNGGKGKPLPSMNPTSGGPPGRSTRVLDSSGCLASVAYATYDRPGAWRLIARANGIDDPLRVRAGTVLYLPQRAERENENGNRR